MGVDIELLGRLCDAEGVPGREWEIRNIMEKEFKRSGYTVQTDWIGNIIAYRGRRPPENPTMFGAHMDEIGLMVKHIDKKGFVRFIKIGGIDDRVLVNQRVVIFTKRKGKVYGVIGNKPPHLLKDEEKKNVIPAEDLFIDIGAKDDKEARRMGVTVGDPITFDVQFRVLNKKVVTGKALDDRVGCYILLELAKRCKRKDVVFVGTVQEEVSWLGKGAMLAAYGLEPQSFIAVDTTIAGDHPGVKEEEAPVMMGKGPSIVLVEAGGRGNVADLNLVEKFFKIAQKNRIPYQVEAMEAGATDAASVYRVRSGIPSIAVCVPTRYIHSNVSTVSLKDIDYTVKLLDKFIKQVTQ